MYNHGKYFHADVQLCALYEMLYEWINAIPLLMNRWI